MPFTQVKENRKVGKVRVKVKAKVKDIKDKAIGQEQSSTEAVPRKVEEGDEAAEEDEVVEGSKGGEIRALVRMSRRRQ